ncbi:MAG: hypothetical protein HRT61_23480, partial [Ekhidna sp.]|nr:hypothetical protein [Ekhidna sp.]
MRKLLLLICLFLVEGAILAQETQSLTQHTLWNRLYLSKAVGKYNLNFLYENRQYIDPWRDHMVIAGPGVS